MSGPALACSERFTLEGEERAAQLEALADDVRAGLTASPKRLSCRFIYDEAGSELFEQICRLPEYYPTDAEREILTRHADRIVRHLPPGAALAELGSGSSEKTQLLISAFLRAHPTLLYAPMDISRSALQSAADELLDRYDGLNIRAYMGEYAEGLTFIESSIDGPKCVIWLGSSIGNLDRDAAADFLAMIRAAMHDDDRLLVGFDLRKDRETLERAYDDDAGVTAAFNRNIFKRINRDLDAAFDVDAFRYEARYDVDRGVVEMFQISRRAQIVRIGKLGLTVSLGENEEIHTESAYKYSTAEIEAGARRAGMTIAEQWFDEAKRYTLVLFAPRGR